MTLQRPARGFTLLEMMITVAVISILAAVALPSYREYVARARRADARATLLAASNFMQRFYASNDRFDKDLLGTQVSLPSDVNVSPATGSPVYNVVLAAVDKSTFTLEARPVATDACGTLVLNHLGQRSINGGSAGAAVTYCWTK